MGIKFCLDSWSAWSPDKPQLPDWLGWAMGQLCSAQEQQPDISVMPAMQRRRMSTLSKMAFATAWNCSSNVSAKPCCIFASRHGELTRTVKIMENIISAEDVSPTDFSLSVFNTALGLFSIFTENTAPSTMVVGGEDTFGNALIEARTHLSRFPGLPVLLVFFDEPLPAPLDVLDTTQDEAFSIALLLSASGKPNIEISAEYNSGRVSEQKNLGLDFLQFYLSGAPRRSVNTERTQWTWSRL